MKDGDCFCPYDAHANSNRMHCVSLGPRARSFIYGHCTVMIRLDFVAQSGVSESQGAIRGSGRVR